jgi:tetratricopeptide (TPR) repeat protein
MSWHRAQLVWVMNPKAKLTAYAVLLLLSAWFAHGFYSNYTAAAKAASDAGSNTPAAAPDETTNASPANPTNTAAATNAASATDTNVAVQPDTNSAVQPDTNTAATASGTNAAGTPGTNTAQAATNVPAPAPIAKSAKTDKAPPDASANRGAMIGYLGAFIGSMIGLGLLVAYDVTQFMGTQAVDFLFNDAGEGQRDPEYERAEQEWANGKFLDAIQLMRDFLKKHPRELYAALRIAEIYEKDLKNHLAAALEYEEVLKNKLPPERWGWAAIHLCNLYSKLNKTDQAIALLRRIADEYPKTGAAKKARVRLGIAEPEPGVVEDQVVTSTESESTGENTVILMEEHPPELEPRQSFETPSPEDVRTTNAPDAPKSSLPPGFRPKK